MRKVKKLISNSFVQKWLITFIAFITIIFIAFALYTYANSQKLLKKEYTAYSELQTDRISIDLDNAFYSYHQIGALLSLDDKVQIYLFQNNAHTIFPNLYDLLHAKLSSYKFSTSAIDSIYLYPANQQEVFCDSAKINIPIPLSNLEDNIWKKKVNSITERSIIARTKNTYYPYLISLFFPIYQSNQKAIVTVNIDVTKIEGLANKQKNSFQSIYIVSDSGEILYRQKQEGMPEPLDTVSSLVHFDNNQNHFSKYVDGTAPYIYVQQHSEKYPWYYVTVTHPQNYLNLTNDFFVSLLSFLPWLFIIACAMIIGLAMLITHPIRTISDFLDDPFSGVPSNISEPETQKIIRQLMNYIQANASLSEELKKQMQQQNQATFLALQSQINPHFLFNTLNLIRNLEIETLGYDHVAPNLTLSLSRLLQYAISSTELVPLRTELYHTEQYLDILNQRYRNKLSCHIIQDPQTLEVLVPKLILQPLIENAVFHGCSPLLDTCNNITVRTSANDNRCIISIEDNGIGIDPEKLKVLRTELLNTKSISSTSIGLKNVVYRMHLTYGETFLIDICSEPNKGTKITLSFSM